jgi:hypothetical protein
VRGRRAKRNHGGDENDRVTSRDSHVADDNLTNRGSRNPWVAAPRPGDEPQRGVADGAHLAIIGLPDGCPPDLEGEPVNLSRSVVPGLMVAIAAAGCATAGGSAAPFPGPASGSETPAGLAAPAAAPSPASAARDDTGGDEGWRTARWDMSPDDVLAAFGREAFAVRPEVKLADGSVIGAGIDAFPYEGLAFNVRFVFQDGRLGLVSLRTRQDTYVDAAAYAKLRQALVARWGEPIESTSDDNFIDMRQTRWNRGASRVDLKYIPGVVAIVHYPRRVPAGAAAPPSPAPASPPRSVPAGAAAPPPAPTAKP